MSKHTSLGTLMTATFFALVVGCDQTDDGGSDRERSGVCIAPTERGTAAVELRNDEVADLAAAPHGEAPFVIVDLGVARVELRDDGRGLDDSARDGVFTAETDRIAAPAESYCLTDPIDDAPDATPDGDALGDDDIDDLVNPLDPQELPNTGGCDDWHYVMDGNVQVWYCTCFHWDHWSC